MTWISRVDVDFKGEEGFSITFDGKYLIEAVSSFATPDIRFRFSGSETATLMDCDGWSYTYLLMPIKT